MTHPIILNEQNSSWGKTEKKSGPPGSGWEGPDTEGNLKNKITTNSESISDYILYQDDKNPGPPFPPNGYYIRKITSQQQPSAPQSGDDLSSDPLFSQIPQGQQEIIKSTWKVKNKLFIKKGETRFYRAGDLNDKNIYMGSWSTSDKIGLVKDIGVGKELHNNSYYTISDLTGATEDDLKQDLIDVKSIKESKKSMKNILKEEYQKRENDKKLILKRFNLLSESKKTWTASHLISEVNYLKKQNFSSVLIKESLIDLMKVLYNEDPSFVPKIKDSYKKWLKNRLPNEGDLFNKSLDSSIDDLENDAVPDLFSDCNKVVDVIYNSMMTNLSLNNIDVLGVPSDIEGVIRAEIIDNLRKDELKSKIKQQLTNKICPQYGDLLRNTQKTFDDIKNKLIS